MTEPTPAPLKSADRAPEVAVAPLNTIDQQAVGAGAAAFDKWLRKISHDCVTLKRLSTVTSSQEKANGSHIITHLPDLPPEKARYIKTKSYQSNRLKKALLALFVLFFSGAKAMELSNIVDNGNMAAELANIYISNIYGKQAAERQKPYSVVDAGSYWQVQGIMPKRQLGGTFEIHIAKKDGQILFLRHGR